MSITVVLIQTFFAHVLAKEWIFADNIKSKVEGKVRVRGRFVMKYYFSNVECPFPIISFHKCGNASVFSAFLVWIFSCKFSVMVLNGY